MATRRYSRSITLFLMAAFLISPPLTSVLADGLGIDLAHHHCEFRSHDAGTHDAGTHDAGTQEAGTQEAGTPDSENHSTAESDPFQCDQCHLVFAAVSYDMAVTSGFLVLLPDPDAVRALSPVRMPPAFKPPIA